MANNPKKDHRKPDRIREWLRKLEAKADLEGDPERAENMNKGVEALDRDREERDS
jgi:hypothetical protein